MTELAAKDQVRLLISDVGGDNNTSFIYSDVEIENFLSLQGGNVFMASATALRAIASNEAQVLKVIEFLELKTDGAKTADALNKAADKMEAMADDSASNGGPEFVEWAVDPFSYRDLLLRGALLRYGDV